MEKFVTAALVAMAVFFASGYVFSTPTTAQAGPAPVAYLDAHVGYYAQHLSRLGLTQDKQ